jgi:hypothetical protein
MLGRIGIYDDFQGLPRAFHMRPARYFLRFSRAGRLDKADFAVYVSKGGEKFGGPFSRLPEFPPHNSGSVADRLGVCGLAD